jgi:hypothetical protein
MHLDEPITHSFVVRIWLERSADGGEELKWRGKITHLPGDESQSFNNLDRIVDFIRAFLNDAAPPITGGSRLKQRLGRWQRLWGGGHRP